MRIRTHQRIETFLTQSRTRSAINVLTEYRRYRTLAVVLHMCQHRRHRDQLPRTRANALILQPVVQT